MSENIKHFSFSSDLIKGDHELQDWVTTLSTSVPEEGFGIPGVPGKGQFQNIDQIMETVTAIIFTSTVGHAEGNFSQYDDYGYPPNYPSYLEGFPPTNKEQRTEDDIRYLFPSKETTIDIMMLTKI